MLGVVSNKSFVTVNVFAFIDYYNLLHLFSATFQWKKRVTGLMVKSAGWGLVKMYILSIKMEVNKQINLPQLFAVLSSTTCALT